MAFTICSRAAAYLAAAVASMLLQEVQSYFHKAEAHTALVAMPELMHESAFHSVHLWHTIGWLRIVGPIMLAGLFVWTSLSKKVNDSFVIGGWMLASMVMNLVNKEITAACDAMCLIIVLQMLFSAIFFLVFEWQNIRYTKLSDIAKWSVVPFFFAGMLITSLWSLKELSLSAVVILRNMLPILTFCAEKMLYGTPQHVSGTIVVSMFIALLGTVVYGHCTLAVTPRGVFIISINCLLTVVDRLLQRSFLQSSDFTVSLPLCMVLNNVIGIFLTVGLAASSGEISRWHPAVMRLSLSSWSLIMFSCICGCCLGYLGLRCQKLVSATTFLILQNLSKVSLIFVGMQAFGDKVKGASAVGCLLSICGALFYSYERLPQETSSKETTCLPLKAPAAPTKLKKHRLHGIQ